jgi:RNA polymerase sigma-70 factor (sigma-E family)
MPENTFEEFASSVRGWLRLEAYRVCGDWYEADDLVQVALWKVYRRWGDMEHWSAPAAYSRRIMFRTYLTERRRPHWFSEVRFADDEAPPVGASTSPAGTIDDRVVLLAALRRLGPRQRAVVTLRFYEDLTVNQTATVMGCTPGTVTSQTFRALAALRSELESA